MPSKKQNDATAMIIGAAILASGIIIGMVISIIAIAMTMPKSVIVREEESEPVNISAPNPAELIGEGERMQGGQGGEVLSDPNKQQRRP